MENKKITILLIVTLVMVAVLLVFNFVGFADFGKTTAVSANAAAGDDVIAVYGQGKISIKPDVAYITFGVENLDIDPQQAQDYNAAQMDKVITALAGKGIQDADIQTTQYNVYQEYDYTNNERNVIGYRVTNTVRVKLSALKA